MNEAIPEAFKSVKDVTNYLQLIYTAIVCVTIAVVAWFFTTRKSKALVEAQAAAEKAETDKRKAERDKQLVEMEKDHDKQHSNMEARMTSEMSLIAELAKTALSKADGIGKNFDKHVDKDEANETLTRDTLGSINKRLSTIETEMAGGIKRAEFIEQCREVGHINTNVAKIMTIIEERSKNKRGWW